MYKDAISAQCATCISAATNPASIPYRYFMRFNFLPCYDVIRILKEQWRRTAESKNI